MNQIPAAFWSPFYCIFSPLFVSNHLSVVTHIISCIQVNLDVLFIHFFCIIITYKEIYLYGVETLWLFFHSLQVYVSVSSTREAPDVCKQHIVLCRRRCHTICGNHFPYTFVVLHMYIWWKNHAILSLLLFHRQALLLIFNK